MYTLRTGLFVCLASILTACSFDPSGVEFDDDTTGPTLAPGQADDRAPVGDFPDGGVIASSCLIISEYIEGQGNNNKAIELYNCGGDTLNLADFGVCLVRNSDTSCGSTHVFAAAPLLPGQVLTICRTLGGTDLDPINTIRDNCQIEASGAMNFNGDDRLVVFKDVDGDAVMGGGDEVMDALGRISSQPLAPVWSEMTLRRCNFTPADGMGEFVHTDYFTEHPRHDASDFGVAPSEGC